MVLILRLFGVIGLYFVRELREVVEKEGKWKSGYIRYIISGYYIGLVMSKLRFYRKV